MQTELMLISRSMSNPKENEKATIDVITRFHILTGVYPTVKQLVTITGYSEKLITRAFDALVTSGYCTDKDCSNVDNSNQNDSVTS
jgi:hypothetical protein